MNRLMIDVVSYSSRTHPPLINFNFQTATSDPYQHEPHNGKMSGWQIHKYKGIVSLKLNNEMPIPKIVSPTDVLVEVYTSSVNPLDVMMMGKCFHSIFDWESVNFSDCMYQMATVRNC